MKYFGVLAAVLLATQSVSGHYIFKTLIAGSKRSTQAVRQPKSVEPMHDITSAAVTCNVNPSPAGETISINAGETIGFQLSNSMYHQGPVAIYLGKAPGLVANWDGSGENWFKIAEWGAASYNPLRFASYGLDTFTTSVPENIPSGEYLVRIEQIGLHLGTGVPEIFVSCGQVKVNNGGSSEAPNKVAIPGYVSANDPSVVLDIYNTGSLTNYKVPGPAVFRG